MPHCNPAPPHPPSEALYQTLCWPPEWAVSVAGLVLIGLIVHLLVGLRPTANGAEARTDGGADEERGTADFQTMREKMEE